MIRIIITACTVLTTLLTTAQTAQKIGGNPLNLDKSAVMEIESSTGGFLPPRMTTAQRTAIGSPATGLVVYNTDAKKLEVWDGTAWSAGDNLGNHTATANLNMSSKSITNAYEITTSHQLIVKDRETANATTFNLYKNAGKFNIWSQPTSDALSISETTGKTTLTSAAIKTGTNGGTPTAGQVATAADTNGNIIWKSPSSGPKFVEVTPNHGGQQLWLDLPPNGGVLQVNSGAAGQLSLSLPNPEIGTYYTIINNNSNTIYFKNHDNSNFTIDGLSYSSVVNNYRLASRQTLKLAYIGYHQWRLF